MTSIASTSHGPRGGLGSPAGIGRLPNQALHLAGGAGRFSVLTAPRIPLAGEPGRMYETWCKMTLMLQRGLDIEPVITHPVWV